MILFAEGTTLPFDIALLRGVPYRPARRACRPTRSRARPRLPKQLGAARQNPHDDSPLFQLLEYMPRIEVDHSKTDTFRDRFNYSKKYKDKLADAREQGEQAVKEAVAEPAFENLHELETGVVVDMFLTLRDVKAHKAMIELFQPHAAAAAARAHHARAIRLRAQSRGQGAGGERCSRR